MLNPREEVLRLLKDMPPDCTYEDIQYHIYVRQKIERGMRELDQGQVARGTVLVAGVGIPTPRTPS